MAADESSAEKVWILNLETWLFGDLLHELRCRKSFLLLFPFNAAEKNKSGGL